MDLGEEDFLLRLKLKLREEDVLLKFKSKSREEDVLNWKEDLVVGFSK